jgi:hypothetical protein
VFSTNSCVFSLTDGTKVTVHKIGDDDRLQLSRLVQDVAAMASTHHHQVQFSVHH